MNPGDIIDRLVQCQEPISFATTPARAFMLVAQLQLALRHPENKGETARFAREFIQHLGSAIAEVSQVEEVLEIIAQGSHPEWDMTNDQAEEYFGTPMTVSQDSRLLDAVACHVLACKWLASYISVTEGVEAGSILRQAREKAWQKYQAEPPEVLGQLLAEELSAWEQTAIIDHDEDPDESALPY